jgi:Cu(I)/Ag(I) efflux system periplasmic protein CusF
MKNQLIKIASFVMLSISTSAFAAGDHGSHSSKPTDPKSMEGMQMKQSETMEMTQGEVRKIDSKTGKVTLKHGEIKNLQMPPMTMVFSAKEAAHLEGLNKGDNVLFAVDQNMNITHIEKK